MRKIFLSFPQSVSGSRRGNEADFLDSVRNRPPRYLGGYHFSEHSFRHALKRTCRFLGRRLADMSLKALLCDHDRPRDINSVALVADLYAASSWAAGGT